MNKPILLTGDTPSGKLHLGHFVGSLENRVNSQELYQCYFLIANMHAFTTRADKPKEIHESVIDITMDYLACGIDPQKSTIFLESKVPAIAELACYFSMLTSYTRVVRNPTIKDEIRDKKLGDNYSFGFLFYPIMQVADILAFQADIIPVGEDQLPLIELAREIARRFNQLYCGVDPQAVDSDALKMGGLFPIPEAKVGRVKRLIGLGAPNEQGQFLKMSKSLGNSILLSDDPATIAKKVKGMYTDPKRLRATDKGTVENNPLWIFHNTFNPDKDWIKVSEEKYRLGQIGDMECKQKLIDVLVALIEPFYKKRQEYEANQDYVLEVLRQGSEKANERAHKTLIKVKEFIHQIY